VSRRWDPDALATLEHERDLLLRELRDLDGQVAGGEIDPAQRAELADSITARAAEVIVEIEKGRAARPAPPRNGWRAIAFVVGLAAVVGVTSGVLKTELAPRTSPDGAVEATTEERVARLARVVAERPDDVPARLALARMLLQQQDLPAARVHYDAASARDPSNAEALAYAGWIAVLSGNDQEGRARLDRAVTADPAYPDAHALRGLALMRDGDAATAVEELRRYLELAPRGPLTPQVEAVISRLEGRP
jgi:cytochrome c-type biogenesis protein CcmH/NrfG